MDYREISEARGALVVIDTEAGGLDPHQHSVLSVALVSIDGARQIECYIKEPKLVTTPSAMQVNQIDLEWLEHNGLSPEEACERLDAFLSEEVERSGGRPALLIGHNVAFDLAYFKRLYRLVGRTGDHPLVSHRSLDTHTLLWALAAQGVVPMSACGSDGAFEHYQVSPPEALRHTALGDAVATQALFQRLMASLGAQAGGER